VDTFCIFNDGELFLKNVNIPGDGTAYSHEPIRDRKLLLNKREIKNLQKDLHDGLSIIPYRIFTNNRGLIKVEIVLAKGKKMFDKKKSLMEKEKLKFSLKDLQ
jgi:SsrA-binding protein